jgi:hypothetical protein
MSENLNSYSKSDGIKPERAIIKRNEIQFANDIVLVTNEVAQDYLKKEKNLDTALFIIISGGEKKERQYFSCILSQPQKFSKIKIHFLSKKKEGLQTFELLETANKIRCKLEDSEVDHSDSFFLLSDRDHFYPEILAIKPECDKERYCLIVSNPCFEIWLYYSYFELLPSDDGFQLPEVKQMSSEFKGFLNQKSALKGGVDPRKAIFEIKSAIINSRQKYKEDELGIPELFSTNMFELAEVLLPLIEKEISVLIEENKRAEANFRNRKE